MEVSPFPFQGPLDPDEVRGRHALIDHLITQVTARRVTALLGPRRYGKTSVLRKVAAQLGEVTTIWVDLYEVTSVADVAARLDQAMGATHGPVGAHLRRLAVGLSLNLGVVSVQLTRPPSERPDPSVLLATLLQILVETARQRAVLLVVDEFSSISRVRPAAAALRTALQHHYRDLGIVFSGSHPSMMRTLFSSRQEPFYGQADLVEIGPLDVIEVEDLVTSGFADSGRDAGHLGGRLFVFTGGHPQRTMQLADACWRRCPPGGTVDDTTWGGAVEEVRAGAAEGLERIYSSYSGGERDVLRAVARSGSVYGAEAALLGLGRGSAAHARRSLLDSGDLVDTDGGLRVVDPLLADWLRHRFPI